MEELTAQEAIYFLEDICYSPGNNDCYSLGNDSFDDPVFPDGRRDMCAVRYTTDNSDYAFETIYFVWKKPDGIHYKKIVDYFVWVDSDGVHYKKIVDSRLSKKAHFQVDSVEINNGSISVKYSGDSWHDQEVIK